MLTIITRNAITIRMALKSIREAGRSTQGVNLINLTGGDAFGSIGRIAEIEDAEAAGKAASTLISDGKEGRIARKAHLNHGLVGFCPPGFLFDRSASYAYAVVVRTADLRRLSDGRSPGRRTL